MGAEYIAIVFTVAFTIATSSLLGRYMWRVFTGSIEPDGWIHARCRDSYVALCRDDVPCSDLNLKAQ